jgi:uncharacterized OsmC-like protein
MAAIRMKTEIEMKLAAHGQTHARTKVASRDVFQTIDEPTERGGTNLGLTPTETLMASLIGCTNVISKRIAQSMGFTIGDAKIAATVKFDRRGVTLAEEVDQPFRDIVLDIEVETDGTPEQMTAMKTDLAKFCPIAKVIRNSGVTITENWTTKPLETSHEH